MSKLSDLAAISKEARLFEVEKDNMPSPAHILYRPLSYRETQSLFELYPDTSPNLRALAAFEYGVTAVSNISCPDIGSDSLNTYLLNNLAYDIIVEVGQKIIELSVPSSELFQALSLSLDIGFDKSLQADTWKCATCQEKRLDKTRNCPLRGEKNKDPKFRMYLKGHPHSYCVMADKDEQLVHKAMECHRMFEVGVLPDEGGFYDQTHFFVDVTSIVKNRVQKAEMDAMSEVTSKNKHKR